MTLRVKLGTGKPQASKLDLLIALLAEGEAIPAWIDKATGGGAARARKLKDFVGEAKQSALLYGEGTQRRVLLVGLGPKTKVNPERVRRAVGAAVRQGRKLDASSVGVTAGAIGLDERTWVAAASEAAVLCDYEYLELKGKPKAKKRKALTVTVFAKASSKAALTEAATVAEGTNFARDLGNRPGNVGTPSHLAAQAKAAGKACGFKVKVLLPADMKRLGMGGLLGVAKGSAEPPRFIQMEYKPKKLNPKAGRLVLVGKGLTFDSGGISLKPADKMWDMKFDKCGGCAVIGAMQAIAQAKLPIEVIGLVPSTENMPGAAANKPGDVLTAMNGKTIEVLNTDAEGRLILADALAYAERFKADVILDFATLTGSVMVALGDVRAAVMGNCEDLTNEMRAAGDASGELVWPLPMDDDYGDQVKSEIADVKNLGKGRLAGSIAGGWFLRNFVPEGPAWVHVDIAGVAWNGDHSKGYVQKGATGYGVRLAYAFAKARSER